MKYKIMMAIGVLTILTGCGNNSLALPEEATNKMEITQTTTVGTTTKNITHNIVNTIWEYIGINGNYKYVYFEKDKTKIDEFSYKIYDTSKRYKTSACHFYGFGNVNINNTNELVFSLDNGDKYTIEWIDNKTFMMNDVKYTATSLKKVNLVNC